MRTIIHHRSPRAPHEVEKVGKVVKIRDAEEISCQVLAALQPRVIDIEDVLELLQVCIDHCLVWLLSKQWENEMLVDNGGDYRVEGLSLHLRPHLDKCSFLEVVVPDEIRTRVLVLFGNI